MATNGVNPTLLVYEAPAPAPAPAANSAPIGGAVAAAPAQPIQAQGQPYPTPTYRPYYNNQAQQPYGYGQYSNGYAPPINQGAAQPTTLRQLGQQMPGAIFNQIGGGSGRGFSPR